MRHAGFVWIAFLVVPCFAQDVDPGQVEHFEGRVRPVLVEHCYPCHNSADRAEGDLSLDHRDGIRKPSSYGTAVVPGRPEDSLLLTVIRHEIPGLEMPDEAPPLSEETIAALERWIADGAYDPRDQPPTAEELGAATSWDAVFQKRKQWWSLQPIRDPEPPPSHGSSDHPVDRFIRTKLQKQGLEPAPPAERRTLLRRLTYVLTGLPPTIQQIDDYLSDTSPGATERLVDRLLASPHFGERWARHWMDVIRYADSHGSEGDPDIPYAYRYRDSLIRAFNQDVPYDQLVREHVAGDLLPEPRIDPELGVNESALATAHWRMVFHGFAPTDALEEKVRTTDDQINVFSKAFLGLTVSCARCHDHKFDAISQKDYTALFGILGSTRPTIQDVNDPKLQTRHQDELRELKREIRDRLAGSWLDATEHLAERLASEPLPAAAHESPAHALSLFADLDRAMKEGATFAEAWQQVSKLWQDERASAGRDEHAVAQRWDLGRRNDYAAWFPSGNGLPDKPLPAGTFAIAPDGDRILTGIYPANAATHRLSTRHRSVLMSPSISLAGELEVWLQVAGAGESTVRYVVQGYPRTGTVYPMETIQRPSWYWHRYDLSYWKGDDIHLELATAKDSPVVQRGSDRSWFALRRVVLREKGGGAPPDHPRELQSPLFERAGDSPPASRSELARLYADALRTAIGAWRSNRATDAQALLLDACQRDGVLPATMDALPELADLVERYRRIEADVPLPTRAPGLAEAEGTDAPLFERGNHRRPLDPVPRRFLEAIDPTPYDTTRSGRLELAADVLRPDNPLTARVIVNRIWHYLYGRGIVATPDNFGRLGELPSHPELLDYLASRMRESGWSMKSMIRFLLTSRTWQQSSEASTRAKEIDPENRWLSHAPVRRLDAEAIRDTLLALSGQLDDQITGPGDPANGESRRRSVYLLVRRNSLDQLLQTFDAPVPFATVGRRASTNVPAQSLTLLNDPFIRDLAASWGTSMGADPKRASDRERLAHLFEVGLGREPSSDELDWLADYHRHCLQALERDAVLRAQLDAALAEQDAAIEALLEPTRARLLAERSAAESLPVLAPPIARWSFDDDLSDELGSLHGTAHGGAHIEDGGLVLDGRGHVATSPIDEELSAKTLEAWVQLDDLEQSGGGVMTVQDRAGNIFDSIVFAEREPRRWLAGSDYFHRTQDLNGPAEDEADEVPVHVAIAYAAGGSIRAYRNGEPYGEPYRITGPVTFAAGGSQVLFGLRHGAPGGNRMLRGRILEARLYDRALTASEVAASFDGSPLVGDGAVRAALSEGERARLLQLEERRGELRVERAELGEPPSGMEPLARIAHAIFNLKELIYVR